jgi:dTMP kinase
MLIAFEGGEGTGKSTQARLLAEALGDRAVLTFQPGATPMGVAIRHLILDPTAGAGMDARAEALLYAADRAQHIAEVIRPALAAGRVVVCDRYIGSSLAYQGVGRGLGVEEVRAISAFATGGLDADLVVLLDVPPEERVQRLVVRARSTGGPDRIEREGSDFHDRVDEAFHALAEADPGRWRVVDGSGSAGEVFKRLRHELAPYNLM